MYHLVCVSYVCVFKAPRTRGAGPLGVGQPSTLVCLQYVRPSTPCMKALEQVSAFQKRGQKGCVSWKTLSLRVVHNRHLASRCAGVGPKPRINKKKHKTLTQARAASLHLPTVASSRHMIPKLLRAERTHILKGSNLNPHLNTCKYSDQRDSGVDAVTPVTANGVFSHAVGLSTLLASTQLLAGLSSELTSA